MTLGKENEVSSTFSLLPSNAFSLKKEGAREVVTQTEIKQLPEGQAA